MKRKIISTAVICVLLLTAIIGVANASMQSEKPQILAEQQIQQKMDADAKVK